MVAAIIAALLAAGFAATHNGIMLAQTGAGFGVGLAVRLAVGSIEAISIYLRALLVAVMSQTVAAVIGGSIFSATPIANGLGVVLLTMTVVDARLRLDSQKNKAEAERLRAAAKEAQFNYFRLRMRPHFIFNALNSIAALCRVQPQKAEGAIISLSKLIRTGIQSGDELSTIPLSHEVQNVREYLEIEKLRFGDRLNMCLEIDPHTSDTPIPNLALQTITENAILHGLSSRSGEFNLHVFSKGEKKRTIIGVADDGHDLWTTGELFAIKEGHGLDLINQQLTILYGHSARIRLYKRKPRGALVLFSVPWREPGS